MSEFPNPDPWTIRGPVSPAKLSPLYRLGTFMAALGMVLLPLIYLGMIAAIAWWTWDFAMDGPGTKQTRRGPRTAIFPYVVPIVLGIILVIFMIKPLFSRRPKSVEPRQLRREDEPRLFAFIEQICDLVHAPRPRRVLVDLNVNASASLTHGFWSLFSRNLTLTIGLPLAGGLTAQQFGGVLAHEFGHFAQGAGMKTTYVVRVISFWFARVVYERDRLDAALEDWARGLDFRLGIVLHAARLMVWCARRILWVLMWIGQLISSVLMRQMEFDADHYEIQSAGSASFISTAKRLQVLGVGVHVTHEKQREAFQAKRLVDDLPGWMLHETVQLSEKTLGEIEKAALSSKTGWFDTHPSDAERIARAETAACTGVLETGIPASELFTDFSALSREVTSSFYHEILEIKPGSVALQSLSQMTSESDRAKQGDDAIEKYFEGLLGARAMVFLNAGDVAPGVPAVTRDARNRELRAPASEAEKAAAKTLHDGLDREHALRAALGLDEAKISWKAADANLANTKDARPALAALATEMHQAETAMIPALTRFRERLAAAIARHLEDPASSSESQGEIRRCISTLNFIEHINPTLRSIFSQTAPFGAILQNMENSGSQDAVYTAVRSHASALEPLVKSVLDQAKDVAYPLPHARGTVNLRDYFTEDVSHPDAMIRVFLQANGILDQAYSIYRKIAGRLAVIAMEVESRMDAPSTAAP